MTQSPQTLSRLVAIALGLLLSAIALLFRLTGAALYHGINPRIHYAVLHLPTALAASAAACFAAALAGLLLGRPAIRSDGSSSTSAAAVGIATVFCAFWLPILLTGGFWQDDWLLLAASHVRHSLLVHPLFALQSVDVINGNFRPLGIGLYFGVMERFAGEVPRLFLAVNFLLNGLTVAALFRLVRGLGFPVRTATAACLLWTSRGLLYTLFAWACAIGDVLVTLFVVVAVLLVLGAERRTGLPALLRHALAWVMFCLALLSKQSAYAAPLILALLVWLRPALPPLPRHRERWRALAVLVLYSLPTVAVYLHGRSLLQGKTPYPIEFSLAALSRLFAYAFWYFAGFPVTKGSVAVSSLLGAAVVVAAVILIRRSRAWAAHRRVLAFLFAAAGISISLLAFLPTVVAPYYGALAALWVSVALSVLFTDPGLQSPHFRRWAPIILPAMLLSGFIEVRIKQTGLLPSGGFQWGTMTAEREADIRRWTLNALASQAGPHTVVLVDYPYLPAFYAAMILRQDPAIDHVYAYSSGTAGMLTNSLDRVPPPDDIAHLREAMSYHWEFPVAPEHERLILHSPDSLALALRGDHVSVVPASGLPVGDP